MSVAEAVREPVVKAAAGIEILTTRIVQTVVTTGRMISFERINDLLYLAANGGSNHWCKVVNQSDSWSVTMLAEDLTHGLSTDKIKAGFELMAKQFPLEFEQFCRGEEHHGIADIFLQLCLFREAIY